VTEIIYRHFTGTRRFHARGDINAFGVYTIRNTENGREYIGCTSIPFVRRWKEHLLLLFVGRHHCRPLQEDWSKFDASVFEFEVLFVMTDFNEIFFSGKEAELMRGKANLYNMTGGRKALKRAVAQ
jgi:hypothetical protein